MIYMKTLSFLASREVYYHCYRIIEYFIHSSFWYCLCDQYQGCMTGPEPVAGNDFCSVCRTHAHYTVEKLNKIKHDSFELEKFYLNILRDLAEILSVNRTACFLGKRIYYKWRNWQEGTESQTCLILILYL